MSDASPVVSLPFPGVIGDEADCRIPAPPSVKLFAPTRLVRVLHVINGEHFSGADIDGVIELAKDAVIAAILDGEPERGLTQRDLHAAIREGPGEHFSYGL